MVVMVLGIVFVLPLVPSWTGKHNKYRSKGISRMNKAKAQREEKAQETMPVVYPSHRQTTRPPLTAPLSLPLDTHAQM